MDKLSLAIEQGGANFLGGGTDGKLKYLDGPDHTHKLSWLFFLYFKVLYSVLKNIIVFYLHRKYFFFLYK